MPMIKASSLTARGMAREFDARGRSTLREGPRSRKNMMGHMNRYRRASITDAKPVTSILQISRSDLEALRTVGLRGSNVLAAYSHNLTRLGSLDFSKHWHRMPLG